MAHMISLLPLDPEYHTSALQAVYAATPSYWAMYGLEAAPLDQAARDLEAANTTPGRFILGIVQRVAAADPNAGAELIGTVDFRLDWPEEHIAYIGMILVAEPYQRRGIGLQAWSLLKPWLAAAAHIRAVRVGVEQFNTGCLQFWTRAGFTLTGDSSRIQSGEQFVRLLYMEQSLADLDPQAPDPGQPSGQA